MISNEVERKFNTSTSVGNRCYTPPLRNVTEALDILLGLRLIVLLSHVVKIHLLYRFGVPC